MTAVIAPAPLGVALSGNASWVSSRERGNTVVTVEGELDSASAGAIASALALAGATAAQVTVDLYGVDFIDVAGVDAFQRVHRLFEILGLSLSLRAPSSSVRRMLRLTDDLAACRALADVATIALIQERALREARLLSEQLQRALNSRVVIEQAKGMLAGLANVDMDTAFKALRGYARAHNYLLADVARDFAQGRLSLAELAGPR
jgi:anti-anti-sigma factor